MSNLFILVYNQQHRQQNSAASVTNNFASKCATIWPKCAQKCATEEFGQIALKNAPQKNFFDPLKHIYCIFMH